MAASYPASIVNFGLPKQNLTDIIQAADPNSLRDEVVAIETVVGTSPTQSTSPSGSSTWHNDARDFSTINARLINIEAGVVADAHTQYVKITGGNTITPGAITTVGLTIEATSGQTADLQRWKDSAGTTVTKITSEGTIVTNGIELNGFDSRLSFLLGGM